MKNKNSLSTIFKRAITGAAIVLTSVTTFDACNMALNRSDEAQRKSADRLPYEMSIGVGMIAFGFARELSK